jgi:hypothetical protein
MRRMRRAAALIIATFLPAAHAARPLITDDAALLDARTCQLEAWSQWNRGSRELWAVPACNPTGAFEISFGGSLVREGNDDYRFTHKVVQVKTVLRPVTPEQWGVGLIAGTVIHGRRETASGWPGDPYFRVPVSVALNGQEWMLHVNAGATRRRDEGRTIGTWGVAQELQVHPSLQFLAEIFGSDRGRPFYVAGFRYSVVKDRVQLDATYGNRAVSDSRDRWFSIGLRFVTAPLFP